MGLIISLSEADQRKTFYALKVQPYYTTGAKRGHLPPLVMAAVCLTAAKAQGCVDIVVEPEGLLPRRYSVAAVEAHVRANPRKFAGWIQKPAQTATERVRAKLQARLPGAILPA